MKLTELFSNYKEKYPDYIVLIKSGNFYLSYDSDAYIISLLLGYKKTNGKIGFPLTNKEKVIEVLTENNVSFIIDDEPHKFDSNSYYYYLKKAHNEELIDKMANSLTTLIKEKISENDDNFKIIKEFIDEL